MAFANSFFCVSDSILYKVGITGILNVQQIVTGLKDASVITSIYEKDSNTIVTGTSTNGMYVYKRTPFQLSDPLPQIENNVFYTQHLLANGNILTGKDKLFDKTRLLVQLQPGIPTTIIQYLEIKPEMYGISPGTTCSKPKKSVSNPIRSTHLPGDREYCLKISSGMSGFRAVLSLGIFRTGLFTRRILPIFARGDNMHAAGIFG
jgi:hypothetical protein